MKCKAAVAAVAALSLGAALVGTTEPAAAGFRMGGFGGWHGGMGGFGGWHGGMGGWRTAGMGASARRQPTALVLVVAAAAYV